MYILGPYTTYLRFSMLGELSEFNTEQLSLICDTLRDYCDSWDSVSERVFSTFVYLIFRSCGYKYRDCEEKMKVLNCMSARRSHEWAKNVLDNDPGVVVEDSRGGYRKQTLYDDFPELETAAKAFAIERLSEKNSLFNVEELAKFLTEKYQELSGQTLQDGETIRSESSIRLDLMRWGAKWDYNQKRPYFEGHENEEVVEYRKKFVNYFSELKNLYYHQSNDEKCDWMDPSDDPPRIIICHDESTFRSGEMQAKRWFFPENAPFFNKGKGRSIMLSYFLVQHKYCDLFTLSEEEYKMAIENHPELLDSGNVTYENFSANAYIEPGKNRDGYFDNEIVLAQFDRLFKLLQFKTIFKNHSFDIIVDNARTHTAVKYDKMLLFKKEGTSCPYDFLEWEDEDGKTQKVSFFFDEMRTKSKGLLVLCRELKLIPENSTPENNRLIDLRNIISQHKAFDGRTNLEILAAKYKNINIIFCPKYHCELNPIEGVWCYLKQYVRKRTDQRFDKLMPLIKEAKIEFSKSNLNAKLWRRFWQSLNMYREGVSYRDVITLLYGSRKADVISHRKIYNHSL